MNRIGHPIRSIVALSVLAVATVGCSTTGGLGTVPPVPRTAAPSVDAGPPDMTPEPSASAAPSPSATPGETPSGPPVATPKPTPTTQPAGQTMVIRAYFVLDGAPGVEGLVPTLQEVPETTAVAPFSASAR